MEKKNPLNDLMRDGMDKVRAMVDTNAIVGQPISTPDGVTLIPISRVSMGFGGGGAAFAWRWGAPGTPPRPPDGGGWWEWCGAVRGYCLPPA